MRALCIYNNGQFLTSGWFRIGYTIKSEFSLNVGKEYAVYGMALWCGHLLILLNDENSLPNWYPAEIFNISDADLPFGWKFSYSMENNSLLQALWGYDELITVKGHYDALLERDDDALRIFFQQCCEQP